tara:strand:+ start:144 stop:269 length:126 start_codon:yes stop_codon:yes gene_type:complete
MRRWGERTVDAGEKQVMRRRRWGREGTGRHGYKRHTHDRTV